MSNKINEHQFNFSLPLFPNQKISENGIQCKLEMDGKEMKGVTGGHLRFGSNGFTNVVIEFEASCLAQFAAELTAHMDLNEHDQQIVLGGIYDTVAEEFATEFPGEGLDGDQKAEFVKRIIESTVEKLK